jgi:pimeloyl-ACP methyl ester carboxylesterase
MLAYARDDLARMRRTPVPVARPVVILNGYHAWEGLAASLLHHLVRHTSRQPRDFHHVSYMFMTDTSRVRHYAIDQVASRFPLETPLDLVGISMGGLIARAASLPAPTDARCLNAQRIFTLATPHQGARLARVIRPDPASHDMRPGSDFLARLNAAPPGHVRCYTQTNDTIVGATNTAPPGMLPFWSTGTALMSHFTTSANPIFLSDIARHLRGEPPLLPPHAASVPPSD